MYRQPLPMVERVRLWDRAMHELFTLITEQKPGATPSPDVEGRQDTRADERLPRSKGRG